MPEAPEPPPSTEAAPRRSTEAPATVVNTLRSAAARHAPALPRLGFDEQVDLEQQVEFLIVLGQEASAIQLLRAQLRRTAGQAPMPYLKLLEIHRALGERDAYEHTAQRFAARFRVRVPSWHDGAAARLLRPDAVDIALDADAGDSADAFDLPAFEDLLLLYQVADDLARHGDAAAAQSPQHAAAPLQAVRTDDLEPALSAVS